MARNFRKIDKDDWDRIRKGFAEQYARDPFEFKERVGWQQIALYVMVGGGMIGRTYAEQPYDAYIDARVGRRPYTMKEIDQVRRLLVVMAEVAGYDPRGQGREGTPALPQMPDFHGAGVF